MLGTVLGYVGVVVAILAAMGALVLFLVKLGRDIGAVVTSQAHHGQQLDKVLEKQESNGSMLVDIHGRVSKLEGYISAA